MYKMGRALTIEEMLERYRHSCVTEKQYNAFAEDFYQTQQDLAEVNKLMTHSMLQGRAADEEEKLIIKRYNKLTRHYVKLMYILERPSWRL